MRVRSAKSAWVLRWKLCPRIDKGVEPIRLRLGGDSVKRLLGENCMALRLRLFLRFGWKSVGVVVPEGVEVWLRG